MLNTLRPSERLLSAVTNNKPEELLEAIADGADVNFRRTKNTPILLALDRGNKEVAQILIDNGADVNLDNGFGWLPIHEVCRHGWEDWVVNLIKNPMSLTDRSDRDGATPLLIAIMNGHEKIASHLVANGSDVNFQNENGVSPFMLAIERQSATLVSQMIARRGDATLKDGAGRSGLDRTENWEEGRKLLSAVKVEASAQASEVTDDADTPKEEAPASTIDAATGVASIQKRRRPS